MPGFSDFRQINAVTMSKQAKAESVDRVTGEILKYGEVA